MSHPSAVTRPSADQTQRAESRRSGGYPDAAVRLLEEALVASLARSPVLPGWLSGRLAALYRTLGRYDDEVQLLERYSESQRTEEARTRYTARLSKARTIAERKRRRDSVALDSVRASMRRPPARPPVPCHAGADDDAVPRFSPAVVAQVTRALATNAQSEQTQLDNALALLCAEAHANNVALEPLVASLKGAYGALPPSKRRPKHDARYDHALLILLALYFKEQAA